MTPGLRITGPKVSIRDKSTIVDSIPTSHAPPSMTCKAGKNKLAILTGENSSSTCVAQVGDTHPKRFADGAAKPPPNCSNICKATG